MRGNSSCLSGEQPVIIQDLKSWNETGCLKGFYCPNNNASALPQYCPPVAACQAQRLSGGTCIPAQGTFEPSICETGYYCPPPGNNQIKCPAGSFCRQGSDLPIKCAIASRCPEGSSRDMSFGPMGILIIVDILLLVAVGGLKLKEKFYNRGHRKEKRSNRQTFTKPGRFRNRDYAQLHDEQLMVAREQNDIAMEERIMNLRRKPTGFEEFAELEGGIGEGNTYNGEGEDEAMSTDLQLFVQSLSKCLGASKFGLTFEFEDLKFHPPKAKKPILSNVSGLIDAGSLWGVMGASGAGKSTFVNVLMGKTKNTGGITKVNGVAGNIAKYKKIIGYVPQDDIVLPELTVRENILHSARIRLPCTWSDSEIQNHVDILIACLQLAHVKDSLVGSTAAPVISGGQRKRVSIGMELAAAPMALFLDEPTSGLDATAANSIMKTLKALSRLGMTIVTIIHQPRQEIFESLDSLVLLGAGRMIYLGPQVEMKPHFEGLGFQFPNHGNPSDVMGDIIAGEGRLYKRTGDASIQPLIDQWQSRPRSSMEEAKGPAISMAESNALSSTIKTRGMYWYKQIYYCFLRSMVQQCRLKESFFFELGVGAMAGFLIGLAELNQKGLNFRGIFVEPYEMLSTSIDYSSVPQMALLVGLAIGLTASAPGVKIFGEEKLVYWREAAAGHNRFAYYVGKVLSTIPRMILANFHFTVLFALLTTPRISWTDMFTANLLYFWCIYGLASCVSMVTRREDGPLLSVMASLIVGVLNGMSPSLKKVRSWHVVWLWRASPGTWLAEGYFTQNVSPLRYLYDIDTAKAAVGFNLGRFQQDMLMLLALGAIYRVVAFLGLRFMYRHKQR
ncbi:ATP-binding cassette sub-family G member 2 protein [Rutstroemia sp. NJR-2017a BVV2]|nr:ATP-binding cassette sub-family G member 2 protein [Rutstroemia sp. NJR-2017a BVV2]